MGSEKQGAHSGASHLSPSEISGREILCHRVLSGLLGCDGRGWQDGSGGPLGGGRDPYRRDGRPDSQAGKGDLCEIGYEEIAKIGCSSAKHSGELDAFVRGLRYLCGEMLEPI